MPKIPQTTAPTTSTSQKLKCTPGVASLDGKFPKEVSDKFHAYVQERDDRRYEWQQPGLDTTSYRITHHGTALLAECIDPDPLIEDPRLSPAREREGRAGRR